MKNTYRDTEKKVMVLRNQIELWARYLYNDALNMQNRDRLSGMENWGTKLLDAIKELKKLTGEK